MEQIARRSQAPRAGQASLEITISMACALLLLLGSFKVVLWLNERLITRQQAYEKTRKAAGQQSLGAAMKGQIIWNDPTQVASGAHSNDPCYTEVIDGVTVRPYYNRLHIFERKVNCR